ncbi:MAG: glycoside hydrolase family 3 [Acetatifactor sp.]|nr:glycoside hydrolase family 3 [Acetatifactor sp.]
MQTEDVTLASDSAGEPSETTPQPGSEDDSEPEEGSNFAQESGDKLSEEASGSAGGSSEEPETAKESGEESGPASGSETESVPEPALSQAELLLTEMSTKEKVCQLFMVFPSQVTRVSHVTKAGDLTRQGLADYPVGGFIYDKTNMVSREQVTEMLTTVQTYSKIPLILTCDEEGGRVNRLMSTVGTTYIDSMMSYRDQGPEKAAENAETIAGDLVNCGFNADLAPVADVWSNPENKVIGDRAYSDDFAQAATLVAAAVEGFHAGGVACTLKHFPGHGDTAADSHTGAAYVTKTLDELRSGELLSFQAGIDAGADMVMIGHLTVTDIENVPALFSYRIVTQLLREEMGFDGVIITDSLQMKAVTDSYGSGQAAVLAVQAGVDILLCPANLEEAVGALLDAVETGVISEERLNESVLRILKLKEEMGIL